MTMVTYEVDITSEQLFKILSRGYIVVESGRHSHKHINVAAFLVLSTRYGAEETQGGDAEP